MICKNSRLISLFLVLLTVIICALSVGISVSAVTSQAGEVVYFDNSITGYDKVYAYMWNDSGDSNGGFPGKLMTQLTDNIWGYSIEGNYNKVIFSQGNSSGQSDNLDYAGNGMLATPNDNGRFTATWSEYTGTETLATSATTSTTATSSTSTESTSETAEGDYVVYCKNDAEWSNVNVYMWNSDSDKIGNWPGVPMTDIGDGIYKYELKKSYANVIFNNGSTQTSDLVLPGNSYCYNNKTTKWEFYSESIVKIKSFEANYKSPCYTACDIMLTADATSEQGELTYKFTVTSDKGTVTLSNGSSNSVIWVPVFSGNYTLKVEVTDTAGNCNIRELDYVIKDTDLLESAFIRTFSNSLGTKTEIPQNTSVSFMTDAIGGKIGTNLLFYKYEITEPDSSENIAYYTTSPVYSYTPTKLGTYKIKVSVQNSANTTVTNTYTYQCVENITENTKPVVVQQGDVNNDGNIDIYDVTAIQKYLIKLTDDIHIDYADANSDGYVSICDATFIQMKLACIID